MSSLGNPSPAASSQRLVHRLTVEVVVDRHGLHRREPLHPAAGRQSDDLRPGVERREDRPEGEWAREPGGCLGVAGCGLQPQVLVATTPDLRRLWQVGKDRAAARTAWAAYGICQSMLARPRSTDQTDVNRRARVRQRVVDYNATLAAVCAEHTFCRYDQGRLFGYRSRSAAVGVGLLPPNPSGQAAS